MPQELMQYAVLALIGVVAVYMVVSNRRSRAYRLVAVESTRLQGEEMERNRQRADARHAFYTGLLQVQRELVEEVRLLRGDLQAGRAPPRQG